MKLNLSSRLFCLLLFCNISVLRAAQFKMAVKPEEKIEDRIQLGATTHVFKES